MKFIISKCLDLVKQYKELILYIIFGVCTTIVNYITYIVFSRFLISNIMISNLIAWIISVAFAYITNKLWVFESKECTFKVLTKEVLSFVLARVFSLVLDMVILYVMSDLMGINDLIVKIISNIIVIIVNYVLSKFIIFKKGDKKGE